MFNFDSEVVGRSWPAVRIDGDGVFFLISSASGVLLTGNWETLQYDGEDFSSVYLAMPRHRGLSIEEVQNVSLFEEIRPAGHIKHHIRFTLVTGRVYQESEPLDGAIGKRTTVYQKR